jgi:hypothetical protein
MSHSLPYGLVEGASVSITLAEALAIDARVDDVFTALTWRLARTPKSGDAVEHHGVIHRLAISRPITEAGNPVVLVRYTVDESMRKIHIHWIKVYPFDKSTAYSPGDPAGS